MNPFALFRIARRDALDVMGSRTWIILFLSPLLMGILLTLLVAAVVALSTALKVAAPEATPLGHDRVALVLDPQASPETKARFESLIGHLRKPVSTVPRETELIRRMIRFLAEGRGVLPAANADYTTVSAPVSAATGAPASAATGAPASAATGAPASAATGAPASAAAGAPASAAGAHDLTQSGWVGADTPGQTPAPAVVRPKSAPKNARDLQPLNVVDLAATPWETVRAQVPSSYDAAVLVLEPAASGGAVRYRLASDSVLFSRVMRDQVQSRIDDFNQQWLEAQTPDRAVALSIQDHPGEKRDLWLVRALLCAASFSLAFMYYSVGVQSVAAILAGERESRTLEVLLSLPLTRRQVLYGKLLGMVVTAVVPTLFWSIALWVPLYRLVGITVPYVPLTLLVTAFLLAVTATGCAVSASSPSTLVARNRLGMVNLLLFGGGGALMALPSAFWPWHEHPLAALVAILSGGPATWPTLGIMLGTLVAFSVVVLELGLVAFRKA